MRTRFDRRRRIRNLVFRVLLPLAVQARVSPAEGGGAGADSGARDAADGLLECSLKELTGISVTSASRKPEKVWSAASAVFVITSEDIRRSGALTIPDILRMAPGVEVARANDNDWYVTIRGFNEETENKLLVLVDGRSIYSPVFSGVFWYEQDLLIEDIDRIEVIRGPGGAMWGANAVNGVINIITKSAKDRQGGLVSAGGGTADRAFGSARYGFEVGEHGYGAAWVKAFERVPLDPDRNADVVQPREWESVSTGFRYDWDPPVPSLVSIRGHWRQTESDGKYFLHYLAPPFLEAADYRRQTTSYSVQGAYAYRVSELSEGNVRCYVEGNHDDYGNADLRYRTFDVDSQYRFQWGDRQDVVCGAGYRYITDELKARRGREVSIFDPDELNRNLVTLFVDDEIAVVPDRFYFKAGCKLEHNHYTDWEVLPSMRLRIHPSARQVVWAAVSRAVRTPSRLDSDMFGGVTFPPCQQPPEMAAKKLAARMETEKGDPVSEELLAWEVGHRLQADNLLWVDTTLFYNEYDHLRAYGEWTDGFVLVDDPLRYERRITQNNGKEGHTYGGEVSATWRARPNWSLIGVYGYLEIDLDLAPGSIDLPSITSVEGKSPRHQASLRSQWDVRRNVECDIWLRHVGELEAVAADAYTTFDVRFAWRPCENVELSLVGRNLAEEWHREFRVYDVERSVHAKMTLTF